MEGGGGRDLIVRQAEYMGEALTVVTFNGKSCKSKLKHYKIIVFPSNAKKRKSTSIVSGPVGIM